MKMCSMLYESFSDLLAPVATECKLKTKIHGTRLSSIHDVCLKNHCKDMLTFCRYLCGGMVD